MAVILDTNALSAFADGDTRLGQAIADEMDLALPSIVLGEYLFGIRQSRFRSRYESWLRRHSAKFLPLSVMAATSECYAAIREELKSAGTPIPTNDLWIAALAREHGAAVVTRDTHFKAVRGLTLICW